MEEKKLNFKPFEGKNTRANDYFISITKAKGFGLSAGFCKKNDILTKYSYALLLWDDNNKTLGIKFLSEESKIKGSFAITKGKNSAAIMSFSWFKENSINTDEVADKYEVHEYNDPKYGLIYYIELGKKITTN